MSPGDCPNCLRERSVWESLSRGHEASRLRVVGILLRTSPEEALAFARAYRLPFPLYLDRENQLRRVTELPPLTPFKVLVNSRGRFCWRTAPTRTPPRRPLLVRWYSKNSAPPQA
jgi:peroxiredoxin